MMSFRRSGGDPQFRLKNGTSATGEDNTSFRRFVITHTVYWLVVEMCCLVRALYSAKGSAKNRKRKVAELTLQAWCKPPNEQAKVFMGQCCTALELEGVKGRNFDMVASVACARNGLEPGLPDQSFWWAGAAWSDNRVIFSING